MVAAEDTSPDGVGPHEGRELELMLATYAPPDGALGSKRK